MVVAEAGVQTEVLLHTQVCAMAVQDEGDGQFHVHFHTPRSSDGYDRPCCLNNGKDSAPSLGRSNPARLYLGGQIVKFKLNADNCLLGIWLQRLRHC